MFLCQIFFSKTVDAESFVDFQSVKSKISAFKNIEYHLVAVDATYRDGFGSGDPKHIKLSFESYVQSILGYEDSSFDLVFVGGRSRLACIEHALPKVKPGGIIISQ